MIRMTEEAVSACGHDAAEIAALANLLSDQMMHDPDTVQVGEALGGLGTLALRLSNNLFELADPNA